MKNLSLLIIAIMMLYSPASAQSGRTCLDPMMVQEGTHTSPSAPYWFAYVIPTDSLKITISSERLTEEDTYLKIFKNCQSDAFAENDDYTDLQSLITLYNQSAGDTLLILWTDEYSNAQFNWSLTTSPISEAQPGEDCWFALNAQTGINSTSVSEVTSGSTQIIWYEYTMSAADSKIVVTSETDHYVAGLIGECWNFSEEYSDYGQTVISDVYEGQTIHIAWLLEEPDTFNWEISHEPLSAGEACSTPIIATEGRNTLPEDMSVSWFEFTMPQENSKIHIRAEDGSQTYFEAFSDNCQDKKWITEGIDETIYDVAKGETILIRWQYETPSSYHWTLSIEELVNGESCTLPIEASVGTNTVPDNFSPEFYWFQYEMLSANSKLVITGTDEEVSVDFEVISGNCSNQQFRGYGQLSGTQSVTFEAGQGETLWIKWYLWDGEGFSWTLEEQPVQPGDFCSNALPIDAGNFSLTENDRNQLWYVFQAPQNPSKIIDIQTSHDAIVTIFQNNCSDLRDVYSDYQQITFSDYRPSETLYLRWNLNQAKPFEWSLTFRDVLPGEVCSTAQQAQQGSNTITSTALTAYWYHFTMPEDNQKLEINTNQDAIGLIYSSDCNHRTLLADGWKFSKVNDLEAGEEVLIQWKEIHDTSFEWNLKVSDIEAGDFCSQPVQATEGTHNITNHENWYAFTMPDTPKKLIITSSGLDSDSFIETYDDCNESYQKSFYTYGTEYDIEIENIMPGETILLYINHQGDADGFDLNFDLVGYASINLNGSQSLDFRIPRDATASQKITLHNDGESALNYALGHSKGIQFSSPDAHIIIPDYENLLVPLDEITISLWVRVESDPNCDNNNNWRYILKKSDYFTDGFHLILKEDQKVTWSINTEQGFLRYVSNDPLPINEWTYITCTYSGVNKEAAIYYNGSKVNGEHQSTGGGNILVDYIPNLILSSDWSFGECSDGSGSFPGSMDELTIWGQVRTPQEIKKDWEGNINLTSPVLLGHWNMELNEYNEIYDDGPSSLSGHGIGIMPVASLSQPWLTFSSVTGQIETGSSSEITLTVDASKIDSDNFQTDLILSSNDPMHQYITIQMNIEVIAPLGSAPASPQISNYPNPMKDQTFFKINNAKGGKVEIFIFNMEGKIVQQLSDQSTDRILLIEWNGKDLNGNSLAPGIYFYRAQIGGSTTSKTYKLIKSR